MRSWFPGLLSLVVLAASAHSAQQPALVLEGGTLVVTALPTVRPRSATSRALDRGAMIFGFIVGLASVISGIVTLAAVPGPAKGMAYPLFMFGMIGLGGARSDRRMLRTDGLRGTPRLRRHLWRMCAALLIATGSFFLGQAQVFAVPIRDSGLLPVPVFAVLAAMLYWLWRVRGRGTMNSGRLEGHQPSGVRPS